MCIMIYSLTKENARVKNTQSEQQKKELVRGFGFELTLTIRIETDCRSGERLDKGEEEEHVQRREESTCLNTASIHMKYMLSSF